MVWLYFFQTSELLQEPLYINDTFQIGGSFISDDFLDWKNADIEFVNDLFGNDETLFSRTELENKFGFSIPHLKYYQITSSIKSVLKWLQKNLSVVKDHQIPKRCLCDLQKIKTQQVYGQYVQALYKVPSSQNKWIEYYPFLEQLNWKNCLSYKFD